MLKKDLVTQLKNSCWKQCRRCGKSLSKVQDLPLSYYSKSILKFSPPFTETADGNERCHLMERRSSGIHT